MEEIPFWMCCKYPRDNFLYCKTMKFVRGLRDSSIVKWLNLLQLDCLGNLPCKMRAWLCCNFCRQFIENIKSRELPTALREASAAKWPNLSISMPWLGRGPSGFRGGPKSYINSSTRSYSRGGRCRGISFTCRGTTLTKSVGRTVWL
jgi:hypothetical protein